MIARFADFGGCLIVSLVYRLQGFFSFFFRFHKPGLWSRDFKRFHPMAMKSRYQSSSLLFSVTVIMFYSTFCSFSKSSASLSVCCHGMGRKPLSTTPIPVWQHSTCLIRHVWRILSKSKRTLNSTLASGSGVSISAPSLLPPPQPFLPYLRSIQYSVMSNCLTIIVTERNEPFFKEFDMWKVFSKIGTGNTKPDASYFRLHGLYSRRLHSYIVGLTDWVDELIRPWGKKLGCNISKSCCACFCVFKRTKHFQNGETYGSPLERLSTNSGLSAVEFGFSATFCCK